MDKPKYQDLAVTKALETFLQRTCAACKKRLYTLGPCEYCGDGSVHFRISYEDIPANWTKCRFKMSIVERDVKDNKRSYTHKKSGRSDLEITFQKEVGGDGRMAYKLLIIDRMKGRKRHTVHLLDGDRFCLEHDESGPLWSSSK